MRDALTRTANAVEELGGGLEVAGEYALTESERTLLTVRRDRLAQALTPADETSAARRIAKLFELMAIPGEDAQVAAKLVSDYAKLLASQPLWAVDAACMLVINSGATFRPSAPELLAMARRAATPARIEAAQLDRALTARVYSVRTPEERERVKVLFADFSRRLAPDAVRDVKPLPTADQLAEGYAAEPVRASDALLRSGGYRGVKNAATPAREAPRPGAGHVEENWGGGIE